MARQGPLSALLFWTLLLSGGGCLAAALILPPWLEFRVTRQACDDAAARVAELELRLTAIHRQIEHIERDPAYNERLARGEFGIQPQGVETIRIDLPPPATQLATTPPEDESDPIEKLGALVDEAARRSPWVAAFVLKETRPIVLAMSGAAVLAAVLLFSMSPSPRTRGPSTRGPQSSDGSKAALRP